MTKQEQIYNWLTTGLQQPADRLSEIFYYDNRDNPRWRERLVRVFDYQASSLAFFLSKARSLGIVSTSDTPALS